MSTAEIQELQRQLLEQRAEIARLTPVGAAAASGSANSADKRLESIVDTKILNRIGVFSGQDEDWRSWCFVFESTAGLIDLESVILACEGTDEISLDFSTQSDAVKLRMKALYHLLVATTRGRP